MASPLPPGTIDIEGHQFRLLAGSADGIRIIRGRMAIYAVGILNGEPTGARHYLVTVHDGALIMGATLEVEGRELALLAVPLGSTCRIEEISPDRLVDPKDPDHQDHWDAVTSYCTSLVRMLVKLSPVSSYSERPSDDGEVRYDAGVAFEGIRKTVSWFQLDSGQVNLFGLEGALRKAGPALVATAPGMWFLPTEPVTGKFLQPSEVFATPDDAGRALDGVVELCRIVLRRSEEYSQAQADSEARRLGRLQRQRMRQSQSVVRNLSLNVNAVSMVEEASENPLLAAMIEVGREIEVEFKEPENIDDFSDGHERIAAIVRASGTRLRRVKLMGAWWEDDVGTLLAFREDTGAPVALVCTPRWWGFVRGYRAFDPTTGRRFEVEGDWADGLKEEAYTFVTPLPDFTDGIDPIRLARFTVGPYIKDVRLILGLSLAGGFLGMISPIANKMMVDTVIPDANRDLILDLALGMTSVSLGMFLFSLSQGLITLRVQVGLTGRLEAAIVDRLLRLPSRFFRKYSSGDLLNRSMMISEISTKISSTVVKSLLSLLNVFLMLALCFYYSRKLAWLAVITAFITGIFSVTFSFLVRRIALVKEIESGKLFGFVVQMIHGVSKLQVAGAEDRAFGQWAERYGKQLRQEYQMDLLRQTSGVINGFLQMASTAILFYMAGKMVQATVMMQMVNPLAPPLLTIGIFFAFQGAFSSAVSGIVGFFHTFVEVHQLIAKRELVRPILEAPMESSRERTDPGLLEGHIKVHDVLFRYAEDGPVILDQFHFEAYPGEFVAVVGPSGSGKSTLLKLLLGFEAPERGTVMYDGRDLASLDLMAVRRQVGVVLQDGRLNAGTIYQIISGARPITLDHAWAAAEEAGFAEDIKAMPMGMHTLLPEGALTLSGGQRQRLMIARSLSLEPRVVFFDEATSALDNRTQRIVSEALQRRKVTRIVVAHRLSTIRDANRIFVVDRGRIVETGNYEELMANKAMFYKLAVRQLIEDPDDE